MSRKIIKTILATIFLGFLSLSGNSQSAEEIFQQGNSLSQQGKFRRALILVDRSLDMDSSLYQRYLFRAQLKFKLHMIESAISDVSICIERCACSTRKYHVSTYYLERANLQLVNKDSLAAMEDINKSLSQNSNNWQAYNLRSMLFMHTGKLQLALSDLNKSFALNNSEGTTLIARGKLKIKLGDFDGACTDLSQAVAWGFDEFKPWIAKNCKK